MKLEIIAYVTVLVSLLVLDAAWLSWFVRAVFKPTLGAIVREKPSFAAACVFYLIYAAGLTYFAVIPGLGEYTLTTAFELGCAIGFLCYATYDFTNFATLRAWTVRLAVIDMGWGTLMSGCATIAAVWVCKEL